MKQLTFDDFLARAEKGLPGPPCIFCGFKSEPWSQLECPERPLNVVDDDDYGYAVLPCEYAPDDYYGHDEHDEIGNIP